MCCRRGLLKGLALWQILLIVVSLFSFSFLIYESSLVSSQEVAPLTWAERIKLAFGGDLPERFTLNPAETSKPGLLGNIFGDTPFGTSGLGASLVSGLIYGGIAYGVGYLIGSLLGLDDNNTQALSTALGVGVFVLDRKA